MATAAFTGSDVVAYASKYLGVPYLWGGTTPAGFDCSGLVQYVFKHFGVSLPRTSYDQATQGVTIPKSQIQPGDVLFYDITAPNSHETLYIGGGKVIAARRTGLPVMITSAGNFTHAQRFVNIPAGTGNLGLTATPAGLNVTPTSLIPSPADIWSAIADSLGVTNLKDAIERLGLILFGAGLILVGLTIINKRVFRRVVEGTNNAANSQRTQSQNNNAKGVREKQGDEDILRMGEQEQEQGNSETAEGE